MNKLRKSITSKKSLYAIFFLYNTSGLKNNFHHILRESSDVLLRIN
jgi:hypothetical protein